MIVYVCLFENNATKNILKRQNDRTGIILKPHFYFVVVGERL